MNDDVTLNSRFRRLKQIGASGTCNVHLATQLTLDRVVVVKEVKDLRGVFPHLVDTELRSRLEEEVRKAARLSHPNIVPILEADTSNTQPCIISEYVEGKSLRHVLNSTGPLSPERVVLVFLQILHALRYAHDQGVLHRGLKPENVLIDRLGNARVTDFGLALLRTQASRPPLHIDTSSIAYLAPEVFSAQQSSGPQVDLYALGILLYEMLSGRIPGRRSPMPTSLHSELSPSFDAIFDRLTLDDPSERYRSADQVLEDCDYSEVRNPQMIGPGTCFFFDSGQEPAGEQSAKRAKA